jgi:hypothetical protein
MTVEPSDEVTAAEIEVIRPFAAQIEAILPFIRQVNAGGDYRRLMVAVIRELVKIGTPPDLMAEIMAHLCVADQAFGKGPPRGESVPRRESVRVKCPSQASRPQDRCSRCASNLLSSGNGPKEGPTCGRRYCRGGDTKRD